jgi:hypothetical protein
MPTPAPTPTVIRIQDHRDASYDRLFTTNREPAAARRLADGAVLAARAARGDDYTWDDVVAQLAARDIHPLVVHFTTETV